MNDLAIEHIRVTEPTDSESDDDDGPDNPTPTDQVLELATIAQKAYLAVEGNTIITPDEARQWLNRAGADIAPSLPEDDEDEDEPEPNPFEDQDPFEDDSDEEEDDE